MTTAPPRVLVADDARLARRMIRQVLEVAFAAEVVEADSGTRAVELARTERFDLAIVDLNMPGASGVDVLRELRKGPSGGSMPFLFATADDLADERLEPAARDARCVALAKPFGAGELEALARAALGAWKTGR